jgi:predicted ATPase
MALVKSARAEQDFQVMLTTHSPALLNALDGDDHMGVLVVARDRDSSRWSNCPAIWR